MRTALLSRSVLAAFLMLPLTQVLADEAKELKGPVLHLEAQAYTEV